MKRITIFILIIIFLWGCSKKITEEFLDLSSPSIISTSPADNEINVSGNAKIIITFSENVDSASITSSDFSISPNFNYTLTIEENIVTITPSQTLPAGQKFTITVSSNIKDKNGNNMKENYSFSFKIEGHNLSQAEVTFLVDASAGKDYYPYLYCAGSWDIFGDYDSEWNNGKRYPMYDDGNHNDGKAGDGIWGYTTYLSVDMLNQYKWVVDNDADSGNGYIKSEDFYITTSSPVQHKQYLYSPISITFNYYDIENKITDTIYLRGAFNNWGMRDRMNGPYGASRLFTITKSIPEGTYTYKYYADSDWDKVNQNNRTISVVYGGATTQNDYYEGGNSVTFNYYDIENKVTSSIYLKGDFNGWSDANRMEGPFGENRRFTTTVNMNTGVQYSYKYYVDNDWDKVNKNNRTITISGSTSTVNDYYAGPISIKFIYYDIEGKVTTSIHITGDFNSWTIDYPYQMSKDSVTNYKYYIDLELNQGTYNYKYYVDGDWDKVNINNRTAVVSPTNQKIIKDYYTGP